ncbi:MAG: bifunctional demethylmenaquinone methyltransferase/2-methoxy-6-polyprenyl-1,4-benzoquinol methylase UbiE [Candidatus Caenarcaniphilales bacterium]|nr:bifunctional demethylmenaquinone methyltransferase/2-methoxy-6-polyprenyl-1,4-benzoquinol methylase UbiE [Candidatus Caenarcaniphilales bacterium]
MPNLPNTQEKSAYVHNMFGSIAAKYDFMNDFMTLGMHRLWKKKVCKILDIQAGHRILDLCCGTGDLTVMLAKNLSKESQNGSSPGEVIGLDFSDEMLSYAKERKTTPGNQLSFIQGDALNLPFNDEVFDRCTVSFGLRNVSDYLRCLKEVFRVSKPEAKFVILDLSHPSGFWDYATHPYRFFLLPFFGRLLAGNSSAYDYLPNSIKNYPDQEGLKKLMQEAGFKNVSYKNLFGGLLAIHVGNK